VEITFLSNRRFDTTMSKGREEHIHKNMEDKKIRGPNSESYV